MTVPILAASFLAVCVTLGYAAVVQVSQRHIPAPLSVGTGLGALMVTAAAFGAPGATVADAWVGALLLVAAVLLFLAPSIDAGRRADLTLDGSDLAAAAVTTALIATLVRIGAVLAPGGQLAVAAALLLVVAVGARSMPEEWRRGPILGLTVGGALIGVLAGWSAVRGGVGVLATPGPIWKGDLSGWPAAPVGGSTWQAPVALALLALAAGILLPPPWRWDVSGVAVVLATIGAPAAFDLAWWSPVLVGGMVATVFGMAAVATEEARAGLSRATVAGVVALHAAGAGLVRPWTTALALGSIALIGVVVATLARVLAGPQVADIETEGMPPHLAQIGGAAIGAALLALPGCGGGAGRRVRTLGAGGADRRAGRVQPRPGRRGRGPPAGAAVSALGQRGGGRRCQHQRPRRHPHRPRRRRLRGRRRPARRTGRADPRGHRAAHRRRPAGPALGGTTRRRPTAAAGRPGATAVAVQPGRRRVGRGGAADRPGTRLDRTRAGHRPGRAAPHTDPDLAGPAAGAAHPTAGRGQPDPRADGVAAHRDRRAGRHRVQRWATFPGRAGGAARGGRHPADRTHRAGPGLARPAPSPRSPSSPSRCSVSR